MRRYELVSGIFFSILALAQLTRTLLAWPVQVAGFWVPGLVVGCRIPHRRHGDLGIPLGGTPRHA